MTKIINKTTIILLSFIVLILISVVAVLYFPLFGINKYTSKLEKDNPLYLQYKFENILNPYKPTYYVLITNNNKTEFLIVKTTYERKELFSFDSLNSQYLLKLDNQKQAEEAMSLPDPSKYQRPVSDKEKEYQEEIVKSTECQKVYHAQNRNRKIEDFNFLRIGMSYKEVGQNFVSRNIKDSATVFKNNDKYIKEFRIDDKENLDEIKMRLVFDKNYEIDSSNSFLEKIQKVFADCSTEDITFEN
jgi:hypothetical protein